MKQREWPNNAKAARDEAVAQATQGLRALAPLLSETLPIGEQYRRIALAMHALHEIKTLLTQQQEKDNPS